VFFGGIGNAIVVVFLGLYVAADPRAYQRALLLALPRDLRDRARTLIDEIADTLRAWMLGQLVSMGIVGCMSFAGLLLIGMPGALVLSVQIALFAFVPYIGALIGGSVIVLAAFAQGTALALWALGVYLIVQLIESYAVTPLVQRRAVSVAPAFAIAGVVVLGTLFGFWGLVLAAPLLAALRVMLLELWVEDAADEPVRRAIARR
jgi:predicted PurR-regulated permease PerM